MKGVSRTADDCLYRKRCSVERERERGARWLDDYRIQGTFDTRDVHFPRGILKDITWCIALKTQELLGCTRALPARRCAAVNVRGVYREQ